ncbi:MAG TPA: three-Cys-motif partner protein TcmP [Gemmatimonadaceae bacterium]
MAKKHRDYFITVDNDGLPTNEIGPWAEEKYQYVGMYAQLFSTGMKNKWSHRIYLDLFSGPGYSRVRDTNRVVLGSPMIALNLPDRFDSYVFADENTEFLDALRTRVSRLGQSVTPTYIPGDANEKVGRVLEVISKTPSKSTLCFCFLDPYKLNIHFETVRRIAEGRAVDFLILLALYIDANRNVSFYVAEGNPTIDLFLGDTNWRQRWKAAEHGGDTIVEFLANEYSTRMRQIGYLPMSIEQMVKIRTHDRRLPLYYLAFFSKHETGLKFWDEVRKYATDQLILL